jgi:outer membrane immunogenic protein
VARWNFEEVFDRNPCAAKGCIFFGGVADLSPHAHEIALGKCINSKTKWSSSMMKRLLLSGIALAALAFAAPVSAADMPNRGPIYKAAPEPLFNWTGFYVGGHGGYGWADDANLNPKGWFGGGQVGYNWQYAPNWVFGVEADISGSDISQTNGIAPLASSKVNYFGTARARLGYTVDRVMVYGTGGLAWAHDRVNDGLVQANGTQVGWTGGAGIEYAFAPNWSTKLEWLYADYGNKTYALTTPTRVDLTDNTVKLGLNYRFGGPVYSRY